MAIRPPLCSPYSSYLMSENSKLGQRILGQSYKTTSEIQPWLNSTHTLQIIFRIVLVLVPLTFILYDVQHRYRPASRDLKRVSSTSLSPIYSHFSETLSGLTTSNYPWVIGFRSSVVKYKWIRSQSQPGWPSSRRIRKKFLSRNQNFGTVRPTISYMTCNPNSAIDVWNHI